MRLVQVESREVEHVRDFLQICFLAFHIVVRNDSQADLNYLGKVLSEAQFGGVDCEDLNAGWRLTPPSDPWRFFLDEEGQGIHKVPLADVSTGYPATQTVEDGLGCGV